MNSSLFYHTQSSYIYTTDKAIDIADLGKCNIDFPFVFDTEFDPRPQWLLKLQQPRIPLTFQIKAFGELNDDAEIYSSEWLRDTTLDKGLKPPYKTLKNNEPVFIRFLKDRGLNVDFRRVEELKSYRHRKALIKKHPTCTFVIYVFFGVADLMLTGVFDESPSLNDSLVDLMRNKSGKGSSIECKKRLKATTSSNDKAVGNTVFIPYLISINGKVFICKLKIIDTCALHGKGSYFNQLEAVGLSTENKDLLSQEQKENMLETILSNPKDFDKYSRNDLSVDEILVRNTKQYQQIEKILGIGEDHKSEPKLTIGATVAILFEKKVKKKLCVNNKEENKLVKQWLNEASTKHHSTLSNTTAYLLAKVFGGRCVNNSVLRIYLNGIIIDIDISSCYGNGLRNQNYFIGRPLRIEYPKNCPLEKMASLREFLRKYEKDLSYGRWSAVVCSKEDLELPQDLIQSYFDYKIENNVFDPKSGVIKVFKHQIINGAITHDILEWLLTICSKKQRDELLDKLVVKTASIYPLSARVDNFESLKEGLENSLEPCFMEFNLGELIVNELIIQRKLFKKTMGDKNPMEQLFKLITNTLFGDMCSIYFDVSNGVVGNNITARARVMVWLMEKGFQLSSSITDGGCFDPNRILDFITGKGIITNEKIVSIQGLKASDLKIKGLIIRPLGGYDKIDIDWDNPNEPFRFIKGNVVEVLDKKIGLRKIEQLALEHLRKLFPKMTVMSQISSDLGLNLFDDKVEVIHHNNRSFKTFDEIKSLQVSNEIVEPVIDLKEQLGIYSFEIKDCFKKATFHGTSNYSLINPNHKEPLVKMRSYENGKHTGIVLKEGKYLKTDIYDSDPPSKEFLVNQLNQPDKVNRAIPFSKTGILKPNQFVNQFEKFQELGLVPGDNLPKYGMLKEFSLAQFTFLNLKQYEKILREYNSNRAKYGQSFEFYFLNDDGTLNYQKMIETIYTLINSGCESINKALDKSRNRSRNKIKHPYKEVLEMLADRDFIEIYNENENENQEMSVQEMIDLSYMDSDDYDPFA